MTILSWSMLVNGSTNPFNASTDILNFNDTSISASDSGMLTWTGTDVVFSVSGKANAALNKTVHFTITGGGRALTDANVTYANGSKVLIGDKTQSIGNGTTTFDDAANSLTGTAGGDLFLGLGGDDTLNGGAGNDKLNGDTGTDTASYASAAAGVTVNLGVLAAQNTVGAGSDTLSSIENLTGSDFNDTLTGNSVNNILNGGSGNDKLNGGSGTDTASYAGAAGVTVNLGVLAAQNTVGAGSDTLSSIENLTGSAFNDTLTGNTSANVLNGGRGNDTLNGGLGNDTLIGGAGNDIFVVNVSTDAVTEELNAGTDTLQSSVSYSLFAAANVENLTLLGTADINGTGNTLNNILRGNSGNNVLDGSTGIYTLIGNAGDDTLSGGSGNDMLTGGTGEDTFRFDVALGATNSDRISDFVVRDDTIQLENAVFTSLISTGRLATSHLRRGAEVTTAADADDFLIYNTTNGALFYDADGNGAGLAQQFAILTGTPNIRASDFFVT